MTDTSKISAGPPISSGLAWGTKPQTAETGIVQHVAAEKDPQSPLETSKPRAQPFTDAEVDELLLKLGLKPSDNSRAAARFLMRHHFQLSRPLMDVSLKLLPQGPWENHGPAEALVAALSRLPLEDVPAGFRVLLTAFTSRHPTVMSLLHHMVGQLEDLISSWLVEPEPGIPSELILPALKEERLQWKNLLELPKLQIALLMMKGTLIKDLRRFHLMSQSLSRILLAYGSRADSGVLRQLATLQQEMRHAIDLILSDMILSRDDQDHHFKEEGQCSTLGLWQDGSKIPARLWADGDSPQEDDTDPAWWFRFHWNDQPLGRLKAEVQAVGKAGELQFSHDRADVRQLLEEHKDSLTQRLKDLGFDIESLPPQPINPKVPDPEAELHSNSSGPLHHVDSKA